MLQSDNKTMAFYITSFLTALFETFNKKKPIKLVLCCILLRVIPLGLALQYRYYSVKLVNVLSSVLLSTVAVNNCFNLGIVDK